MDDTPNNNNSRPSKPQGLIANTFALIGKIIGLLILSAVLSIIIEWIGITFYYPEEGYKHSERMMMLEIGYLNSSLMHDSMNGGVIMKASEYISGLSNFLFIDSGLVEKLTAARTVDVNDGRFRRFVKGLVNEYFNYCMSAIYILIMFFIRLSVLALSMPAFALFGLVGMADGLMQRDLRRWGGGNESAYVYHWAKRFALPVLIFAWVVYLSIPNSIHPNFIITPFAVLFGLVLLVMTSKFKKYL